MSKTFKSHLGNSFTDYNGEKCESWQMVCNETGTAFATLDILAGKVIHFMAADSVSVIAAKWRDGLLAKQVCAPAELDTFTLAYIEAALFSSNDESNESGGEPLDKNYSIDDFAPESLAKIVADCAKFQAENDLSGYGEKNAGHDFWFTRNGHGVGFWENDHGTEVQCKILDAASKAFGECNIYVGDDKKLWI